MCSRGYNLVFQDGGCEIKKGSFDTLVVVGTRTKGNVYQLKGGGFRNFISQINKIWLWHRRMGHINFDSLVKINSTDVVRDLPKITKHINAICKECQFGKKTKKSFKTKEYSTIGPLELVHTDLCGPTKIRSSRMTY